MSTTAPAEPTCGNCRYAFRYAERLLCRRYPPSPKHNSGFNGVADTRLEYWCGEWKQGADATPVLGWLP